MREKILAVVTLTLKQIKSNLTIYLDSVMQSDKELYSVVSIEEAGTENVGKNIQNKAWLVDIAFVDKMNQKIKPELLRMHVELFLIFLKSMGTRSSQKCIKYLKQMEWHM